MTSYVERVAETTFAEFQTKLHDKPIIVIYPRNRGRGALIALFLQHYKKNLIYYNLTEKDNNLNNWLSNMADDDTFPVSFGVQIRAALNAKAEPEELAEAFAADMGTLRSESFMLLLDSLDNMQADDAMNRFFRAVAPKIPDHAQLVVAGRLLYLLPWNDLLHQGYAEIVGNEEALGGGIYGETPELGQLEVFALSGGHVYIDGRPVTSWDGSLPRHLFYYFVDHTMVTRDEIFSIFWPKMSVKEATNVFHVTKRKISERLGYELTNYSSGFYIPSPRLSVHYDARIFEGAVHQAIELEQDAPANWYLAVQLYRSDYLPYIHTPWVVARREQLKHKYAQALIGLGRYHRSMNELEQALGYLLRALREKPDWEDVHQDVMMIYHQLGRQDDAVGQFKLLEATLKRMFNITPSKETRRLYEVIAAV